MRSHWIIISVFLLCCSCQNRNNKEGGEITAVSDMSLELELPEVPEELVRPEERAQFVALHFWDDLDFSRDQRALDTAFVEQNFVNFIDLLPYVPQEGAGEAVAKLLDKAAENREAASLLSWVTERYLDDPNSPMRSEELYILFLQHISESEKAEEGERERADYRLRQAMKNRPGSKGADFRMLTRDGGTLTLMEGVRNDTTLVMFYDPDCSQCKEFTPQLISSETAKRFKVLAVDVATDRGLWDSTKDKFPADWTVGFALDPVDDEGIYVLPALPSVYLMAPDGTVILKDININAIQ